MPKQYIQLRDLEIYKLSRELSAKGWEIYENMDWQTRKIMGDQFIAATDSIGANVAEGYGRFHYLDKIKFFYNARGSFIEASEHWLELLKERGKVNKATYDLYKQKAERLSIKLQNHISSTYKAKTNSKQ